MLWTRPDSTLPTQVRRVDSTGTLEQVSADVAAVFSNGAEAAAVTFTPQKDAAIPRVTTPKSEYSSKGAASTMLNTVQPLVVAGPSGVGKGTLIKKLQARRPSWVAELMCHK